MPHFAPRLAISCHKVRLAHKLIGVQLGGVNIPSSLSRAAARLCPGGRGRSVKVMASSSSKISDGQLVEEALKRLQSGNSSINAAQSLVDIGINLADPAYDKVGAEQQLPYFQKLLNVISVLDELASRGVDKSAFLYDVHTICRLDVWASF